MSHRADRDKSLIVCVDVGSVARHRFAWASSDGQSGSADGETSALGEEPGKPVSQLVELVAGQLASTPPRPVALGFECPTWVPIPTSPSHLGRRRPGEGRYSWSAGAGAGALATGVAQIAWILRAIKSTVAHAEATTDRDSWDAVEPGAPRLLLWEAFVPGARKSALRPDQTSQHLADAKAGLDAFENVSLLRGEKEGRNEADLSANQLPAVPGSVNLLALLAAWSGMEISGAEFGRSLPIYAPALPSSKLG